MVDGSAEWRMAHGDVIPEPLNSRNWLSSGRIRSTGCREHSHVVPHVQRVYVRYQISPSPNMLLRFLTLLFVSKDNLFGKLGDIAYYKRTVI